MKKKVLFALGTVAAAGAIFFSTDVKSASSDASVESLISVNSANAECIDKQDLNNGKCLTLSQICVGDPGNKECYF